MVDDVLELVFGSEEWVVSQLDIESICARFDLEDEAFEVLPVLLNSLVLGERTMHLILLICSPDMFNFLLIFTTSP